MLGVIYSVYIVLILFARQGRNWEMRWKMKCVRSMLIKIFHPAVSFLGIIRNLKCSTIASPMRLK